MQPVENMTQGLSVQFRLDLAEAAEGDLIVVGETLRVCIREAGKDPELARIDDHHQNYLSYPTADGRALALEAVLGFADDNPARRVMRIGVPLALLEPGGERLVEVRVNRANAQLLVDGELVDEDWPISPLLQGEEITTIASGVSDVQLTVNPLPPVPMAPAPASALQYYAPSGHNTWAGDTMPLFHNGRFHLYYLLDRRHGSSKFQCGAHQFAHSSSADLRTWDHHPLALSIDEPWLSYGTGMPIVRDGKILMFFGMVTDRVMPIEQTMAPAILEHIKQTGRLEARPFFEGGKVPQGTAVAVSDDGISFTRIPEVIAPCQDPTPFVDPDTGKVYLLAGYGDDGLYEPSDDLKQWTLVDPHFLPSMKQSPQGNTLECQCPFEWNGWHYIVAGRTGMWMSRQLLGPYWEGAKGAADTPVHRPRWDIYDGLWVPSVGEWHNNRRLLTGWLTGIDFEYAGYLVFRELVQMEDGTLGMKWPQEMIPPAGEPAAAPSSVALHSSQETAWSDPIAIPESCRITMQLAPAPGAQSYGLRIGTCELKFSPLSQRVQYSSATGHEPAANLPALEEILDNEPYVPVWEVPHEAIHFLGADFTIQNVQGIDEPFTLDLIVKYDPKGRGTIIDACIGEHRTIITRRPGLQAEHIQLFTQGADLQIPSLTVRPLLTQ